MGVDAGEADDAALRRHGRPARQQAAAVAGEQGERRHRTDRVIDERARQPQRRIVAPFRIEVEPLEAVDRRLPVAPRQRRLRRIRVGDDTEPAEPPHVLDDVGGVAGQPVRRLAQTEREVVAVRRADLDAVDDEDAGSIRRRERRARAVAVIGDDDELQAGAGRRGGDLVDGAAAVRARRVDVDDAAGDGGRRDGEGRRPRRRAAPAARPARRAPRPRARPRPTLAVAARRDYIAVSAARPLTAAACGRRRWLRSVRSSPFVTRRRARRGARTRSAAVIRSWAWWRKTSWTSSCAPTI